MAWKLGTVRLYTQGNQADRKQHIARLDPLDTNTIYHIFGQSDRVFTVNALVASSDDIGTLDGYATSGSTYTFSGPEGALGSFYVADFNYDRTSYVYTVLFDRPELDTAVPSYNCTFTLYKNE